MVWGDGESGLARLRSPIAVSFFLCSVLGAIGSAHAREEYPAVVRDTAPMPCLPQCLLCHTELPPSSANPNQPFRETIGIPGSPEDLKRLILGLTNEDSDADGMSDIDELKAERDPNVVGEGDICAPEVKYGCGAAHVSAVPPAGLGGAAWFVVGGLVLAGTARARRSPSP